MLAVVDDAADVAEACGDAAFERYTGTPPDLSELTVEVVPPTGGQASTCLLVAPGGVATRPFLDAGELFFADDPELDHRDDDERRAADELGPPGAPAPSPGFDDPELDALAVECFEGDGSACDELFFAAPVASEAEEYGATCAARFERPPGSCANLDFRG